MLLPTKEQAAKLVETHISTKFFQLQPKYVGTRKICVTVCNVPTSISGEIAASFLSAYNRVEDITHLLAVARLAHGDYVFRVCLDREGFHEIPDNDRLMMKVVERGRPNR